MRDWRISGWSNTDFKHSSIKGSGVSRIILVIIIQWCFFFFIFKPISDNLSEAADIKPRLPWFLDCNRERFPYWFRQEEPRNKIILDKLASFSARHGLKPKRLCRQLFEGAEVSCFVNNTQLAVPHHYVFV